MIDVSNSLYKARHGFAPRGLGHWGFFIKIKDSKLTELECPFEHYYCDDEKACIMWAKEVMTLTEAKKQIVDWLKSKGYNKGTIYVAD